MPRRESSTKVRDNWGDVLRDVLRGEVFIVTQRGDDVAVIVSYERYEQMRDELERLRKRQGDA